MLEERTDTEALLLDGATEDIDDCALAQLSHDRSTKKKKRSLWCALVTLVVMIISAIVIVSIFRVVQDKMDTPTFKPEFPTSYEASITIHIPYNGLIEPLYVHVDEAKGLQKLTYYGGMDTYIFNRSGASYQIVPVIQNLTCFAIPASPPQHVFPNLSMFTAQSGIFSVNGNRCYCWKYESEDPTTTPEGLIGTYLFYADVETRRPVQFHYTGHNVMFGGSHIDEYFINYEFVRPGEIVETVFTHLPSVMKCKPFNPDTERHLRSNPQHDLHMLFPEGLSRRKSAFDQYTRQHKKEYHDKEEIASRWTAFHHNVRYINAMNRKGLSYHLALNHLADRSKDELLLLSGISRNEKHTRPADNGASEIHQMRSNPNDLPPEKDWRNTAVTSVKDQGICGSCWSFGTTGALEGAYYMRTKKLVSLSQQNLMDCSWSEGNHGCDGGLDFQAYRWIMASGGIESTETYGSYLNVDGFCHFNVSRKSVSMTGYVNVSGSAMNSNVEALNDALYHVGPLSVAIDASQPSFYFYAGGLYDNPDCKSDLDHLDHSVVAVGYVTRNGQKYTIIKNSWSTWWGDHGYAFIAQKNNVCGVATTPTYPIIS